jgi:hypothetical protein
MTIMALRGNPESLRRRLLLGQEYIAAARSTGSADLLADAYHWQALNYFESGQLEELEDLLEHYDSLSASRFGMHQYHTGAHRVTLALLRGDWTDLENRIEDLLTIGTKTRRNDADGVYGAQMFALNRDLGRLHSLAPQIKEIAASTTRRMWEPGLMLICAEIGSLAEARSIFERLVERSDRPAQRISFPTRLILGGSCAPVAPATLAPNATISCTACVTSRSSMCRATTVSSRGRFSGTRLNLTGCQPISAPTRRTSHPYGHQPNPPISEPELQILDLKQRQSFSVVVASV